MSVSRSKAALVLESPHVAEVPISDFAILRLQLALEFIEELPIGALGYDLLRSRFDEADFFHAQRPEGKLSR